MTDKDECKCQPAPKLIFACSGAADVGRISDMAARMMTKEGVGNMFCLAGVGGRVSGIMESTKAASKVLAIDGCFLECAKLCLNHAGFEGFEYLRLDNLGMEKGKATVSEKTIRKVVDEGAKMLA